MNPFRQLVQRYQDARASPLPSLDPTKPPAGSPAVPQPRSPDKTALLFAPHPDDECIMGALPLRLQREEGYRIINIAVTLGSNPDRQEARRRELEAACAVLGWELVVLGWTGVKPSIDRGENSLSNAQRDTLVELIQKYRPTAVFFPHAHDAHPAHIGVHERVGTVLSQVDHAAKILRIQTEFWHPMLEPNLLVECPPDDLALLLEALACHQGEVARNPYHRSLPAWMIDNVRRGAERVQGAGATAPDFPFGVLYHVSPGLPPGWKPVHPR